MSEQQSAVERLAEQWNTTPDHAPTEYDRGRVEQRHAMTLQLLEAIEADRAGVVAEEPEWEYGYRLVGDDGNAYKTGFAYDNPAEPRDRAKMRAVEENEGREETGEPRLAPELIRRRKAGPWVPVKQDGAGDVDR